MLAFLARRLAALIATLAVTALIVFIVLEILPGDPAAVLLGVNATPETLAALRADLGLDRPVILRFLGWIAGLLTGDLGTSYAYRVPVAQLIGERIQVTLPLTLMAMALASGVGIPAGLIAASRAGRPSDLAIMVATETGLSVPNFWFGILLVLLFSITLQWLPAGGFPGWAAGPGSAVAALLLPAIALALPQAAILARMTRSAALAALSEDWVRTARAKGLSESATLVRHVLRNALLPVLTILGLQFSFLISGSIVIENSFALPGLGRLVFQAIGQHDIIVVKDLVIVFAAVAVIANTAVDIASGLIDPRLTRGHR